MENIPTKLTKENIQKMKNFLNKTVKKNGNVSKLLGLKLKNFQTLKRNRNEEHKQNLETLELLENLYTGLENEANLSNFNENIDGPSERGLKKCTKRQYRSIRKKGKCVYRPVCDSNEFFSTIYEKCMPKKTCTPLRFSKISENCRTKNKGMKKLNSEYATRKQKVYNALMKEHKETQNKEMNAYKKTSMYYRQQAQLRNKALANAKRKLEEAQEKANQNNSLDAQVNLSIARHYYNKLSNEKQKHQELK